MNAVSKFANSLLEESSSDSDSSNDKRLKQKKDKKQKQKEKKKQEAAASKGKSAKKEEDDEDSDDEALEIVADIFTGGIYGYVSTGIEVADALDKASKDKKAAEGTTANLTTKETAECVANTMSEGAWDEVVNAVKEYRKKHKKDKKKMTAEEADKLLHDALTQNQIDDVRKSLELMAVEKKKMAAM